MNHICIQNVVALGQIVIPEKQYLNLRTVAAKTQGSRYNPRRFPAVVIRKTKPKGTVLLFKSGKMIIIGSQSQKEAELIFRKSARDINHVLNVKYTVKSFRITNIVGSFSLTQQVDIGRIADDQIGLKDQNFPGLVYRMGQPVKTALIFASGKVVLCGAATRQQLEKASMILQQRLKPYFLSKNRN